VADTLSTGYRDAPPNTALPESMANELSRRSTVPRMALTSPSSLGALPVPDSTRLPLSSARAIDSSTRMPPGAEMGMFWKVRRDSSGLTFFTAACCWGLGNVVSPSGNGLE